MRIKKNHVPNPNILIKTKKKNKLGKKITILFLSLLLICLVGVSSYGVYIYSKSQSTARKSFGVKTNNQTDNNNLDLSELFGVFTGQSGRQKLLGEDSGRTNFLVIGKDYERNTDSMIILSYYYKEKKITSLSIPRDLVVYDGYETVKANAIWTNADGRFNQGLDSINGESYMANFLGEQLKQPIHYWARINVDSVAKIIDEIGGIEVDVENNFSDCEYPTDNYQVVYYKDLQQYSSYVYPCPKFVSGVQIMDSKTALIFARSRKSFDNPAEAIDFARSKRQSKVIEAIINKLKSELSGGKLALNLGQIDRLFNLLGENLQTSATVNEALSFFQLIKDKPKGEIVKLSLDFESGIICPTNTSDITFCDGTIMGQSPNSKSLQDLQELADPDLNSNPSEAKKITESKITIIGNNSDVTPKVYATLQKLGFKNDKLLTDYNFKGIIPAVVGSTEKVTIYIPDNTLFTGFKTSLDNYSQQTKPNINKFNYEIKNTNTTKYTLPANLNNSAVLIIVETTK